MSEEDFLRVLLGDLWELGEWDAFGATDKGIDYWHGLWSVSRVGIGEANVGIDSKTERVCVWRSFYWGGDDVMFGEFAFGDPSFVGDVRKAARLCLREVGVI
jgi:hypothetical protein